MWEVNEEIKIKAKPSVIWRYWTDVENWNKWDADIAYSKLQGKFDVGTKGELKPKKGPKAKFEITNVTLNKQFKNISNLPLTKLEFNHVIEDSSDGVIVRHSIQMTGLLTGLFSRIVGRELAKGLPVALQNLKDMVEMEEKNKQDNQVEQVHAN